MRRYLALNYAALVVYFLYPMAPPWLASRDGYLGEVHRITSRGWSDIGLDRANMVLQGMGNQVAAMPSLHAGDRLPRRLYGVWRLRSPLRFVLLLYPAGDVDWRWSTSPSTTSSTCSPAGLLAAAVVVACTAWERPPTGPTSPAPDGPPWSSRERRASAVETAAARERPGSSPTMRHPPDQPT